ncbi:ferritin family protein [bacterium]|nr:ferritin family protein [candidate division CSSED10-310 bacterium]
MKMSKAEATIKKAILLEHKGRAFYSSIAKNTNSPAVRDIFESMALEEEEHIRVLTEQLKSLTQAGSFKFMELKTISDEVSPKVLTSAIREEISGAGYEAAAISAAMNFEQQAVDYYQDRARATHDEEEARIFTWLADWEKTHVDLLTEIDKELQEKVWYDQSFWPIY